MTELMQYCRGIHYHLALHIAYTVLKPIATSTPHRFRQRVGSSMQVASAGQEILFTKGFTVTGM